MRPKISGLGAIDPFFGLAAIVPLSKTGAPGFRRGALRFIITGAEIRPVKPHKTPLSPDQTRRAAKVNKLNRLQSEAQIKIGVWRDDSRYPGHKLLALRKERGCGKRHPGHFLRAA